MRVLRKASPVDEYWEPEDLAKHLGCDLEKAKKIMDKYHKERKTGRYGGVEKALILDYIEQKQREQREREMRHQSELSNIERTAVLKEQVKTLKEQANTLKEQVKAIEAMSRSSDNKAMIANIIAFASLAVAVIAICL